MPHYKKAFDIGTYTGNGGQYRVGMPTLRGVGPSGKQVAGSTRFRFSNSVYLSRTPASAGNRTTWTFSCWIKRGLIGTGTAYGIWGSTGAGTTECVIYFLNDGIRFTQRNGGSTDWNLYTTQILSDTSLWYHIVIVFNTTSATSSSRAQIYVNGVLQTLSSSTYPSQNYSATINNNVAHTIGTVDWGSTRAYYSDYYMSEVYFVDGQALTSSSFGEYNSDGIWVPKAYSGTYGTNGFYLPMNSSSNYATDQSGNGNNWTPTGFNVTTSNTTYDLVTDSPTDYSSSVGNYSILNASNKDSSITLSDGNLKSTGSGATTSCKNVFGTVPVSRNQKIYFEAQVITGTSSGNYVQIGVAPQSLGLASPGGSSGDFAYIIESDQANQAIARSSGAGTTYGAGSQFATNDIIQVAIDQANGKVWFGKNNIWYGSGNPSTGANPVSSTVTTSLDLYPFCGFYGGSGLGFIVNFGQRAFNYTVPTGFVGVNTYNYPRPADSALWFYGDTPDLMWIKNRSTTGLHTITDTVRGMGLNYITSSSTAETSYPAVSEMNKFGMSIINDGTSIVNGSGNSMVYWAWKAGSNTSSTSVTNTDGTITSQVSANRQAGFSIVSYTGTGANATVGHRLGAAPSMIIFKNRGSNLNSIVYTSMTGAGNVLFLDGTNASTVNTTAFNNTSPTSSVFSVGAYNNTNQSAINLIAYCWTAIPGYSAFGSYTGNGSTDGPFVYTGFRPRWMVYKRTDTAAQWYMNDTMRDTYNPASLDLALNSTSAEPATGGGYYIDYLSNGFKLRNLGGAANASGGTYIWAAFAEIPFKYARAR
jgi:hypothetical protein